jgi:hypothetical protein
MQQFCMYGSVRGASGNRRPYRDKTAVFRRTPQPDFDRTGKTASQTRKYL